MYADIFGTIPVAESLLAKGAGLGTILSFCDGSDYTFPSIHGTLSKAIKKKLLETFHWNRVSESSLYGFNVI